MDINRLNVNNRGNFSQLQEQPDIEIFDPPMCCSTGMCGPTIDQTLLDLSEMIITLQSNGYQVERYQMSTNPGAFIDNAKVMKLVREKQMAALPIVIVRGSVVTEGRYPTQVEIFAKLNGDN